MLQPELGDGSSAGCHNRRGACRQLGNQLARALDLVDSLSRKRFVRFELHHFRQGIEMRSDCAHCLYRTPTVRDADHFLGVESVPRRPFTPRTLDTFGGVYQNTVEIEQNRFTDETLRRAHVGGRMSITAWTNC